MTRAAISVVVPGPRRWCGSRPAPSTPPPRTAPPAPPNARTPRQRLPAGTAARRTASPPTAGDGGCARARNPAAARSPARQGRAAAAASSWSAGGESLRRYLAVPARMASTIRRATTRLQAFRQPGRGTGDGVLGKPGLGVRWPGVGHGDPRGATHGSAPGPPRSARFWTPRRRPCPKRLLGDHRADVGDEPAGLRQGGQGRPDQP